MRAKAGFISLLLVLIASPDVVYES